MLVITKEVNVSDVNAGAIFSLVIMVVLYNKAILNLWNDISGLATLNQTGLMECLNLRLKLFSNYTKLSANSTIDKHCAFEESRGIIIMMN